ncbi:MAG: hypothetical protein ACTSU5_02690 [Promethearchaeota archaeon]
MSIVKDGIVAVDFIQSIHHHREIDNTDELRGRFFQVFLEERTHLPRAELWRVIEEGLREFHGSEVARNSTLSPDMPFPPTVELMRKMVERIRDVFCRKYYWQDYVDQYDAAASDFLEQYC